MLLGYITFIILNYNYIVGSGVEDFDQRFIVVALCCCLICLIIFLINKARTNELVLEDGIENGMDSPPKYCVEESPPPYEEAIRIERKAIFSNAEISIIL